MLIYSNAFTLALNSDTKEVVLSFLQNGPAHNSEGKISGSETNTVASIVLRPDVVEHLTNALKRLQTPSEDLTSTLDS